eukprot:XP_001693286.1 predicted protein [Chlamydomonas reinhardtii]
MSAFRRAGTADMGTRPGLHGQTLVSMGLVDLDRILGGGLPLSSVLLVLEKVMWLSASPPAGGPGAFLPAEASASQSSSDDAAAEKEQPELRIAWQYRKYIKDEPQQQPQRAQSAASMSGRSGASASTTTGAKSSFARAGAAVAAGVGREWCHSYDLTRPIGEEALRGAALEVAECSGPAAYAAADERAGAFLSSLAPSAPDHATAVAAPGSAAAVLAAAAAARRGPEPVGRLVIESAGSLGWWARGGSGCSSSLGLGSLQAQGEGARQQQEVELLRLLYNVRQRALRARCAVMVTVPAGLLSAGTASRLPHLADSVLGLDPLSDDSQLHRLLPDPASAVALLSVRKLCSAGMLGPRTCDGVLHVVRHKRRRLGLSVVEVDPDAEERLAEATARAQEAYMKGGPRGAAGAAGVVAAKTASKSTAALLCGGPPAPGGGSKALDF